MGRKRRRSGGDETTPTPAASTPVPQTTNGSADGKKLRVSDGKSGKPTKTLKLKLIKAPGSSSSKSVPVVDSSNAVGASNTSAPIASEGKKKKKKKKSEKDKTGSTTAPLPTQKAKPTDTSAIDDLFASLKTAKQEQARADEQKLRDEAKAAQRAQQEKQQLQAHIKKLEAQNTNSIGQVGVNPDPRPVRYDEDGMPIYTEDSLYIGKGGDTADCPFDCWFPAKFNQSVQVMTTVWGVMQPQRSPLKRQPLDNDANMTTVSSFSSSFGASPFSHPSPMKKLNVGAIVAGPPIVSSAPPPPTMMDIRAFGLEDRAEAVIAHGSSAGWSLANLSKWRRESLGGVQATNSGSTITTSAPSASTAYLKQRQRAYRQQMLSRSASASSASSSSSTSS